MGPGPNGYRHHLLGALPPHPGHPSTGPGSPGSAGSRDSVPTGKQSGALLQEQQTGQRASQALCFP